MPTLKFTPNLKRFFPDIGPVNLSVSSIRDLINEADNKFPGLKDYVLDEQGKLRKHVQIFIGNDMVKDRELLSDIVKENEEVYIMQALSGG